MLKAVEIRKRLITLNSFNKNKSSYIILMIEMLNINQTHQVICNKKKIHFCHNTSNQFCVQNITLHWENIHRKD